MTKIILISLFLISLPVSRIFAQEMQDSVPTESTNALTIGFLQGGGSLVGADLELLLYKGFGIQLGAGFFGHGAGINYHPKKTIRSSFISLQYWHQGEGRGFTLATLGPTYNFRLKKLLSFQIGFGFKVQEGPAYELLRSKLGNTDAMLLYSIGLYFPI